MTTQVPPPDNPALFNTTIILLAVPTIIKVGGSFFGDSLEIVLCNTGVGPLPEGNIFALQTNIDGTTQQRRLFNAIQLFPGETTTIIERATNARTMRIHEYRTITYEREKSFPMQGEIRRSLFGWKYYKNEER